MNKYFAAVIHYERLFFPTITKGQISINQPESRLQNGTAAHHILEKRRREETKGSQRTREEGVLSVDLVNLAVREFYQGDDRLIRVSCIL